MRGSQGGDPAGDLAGRGGGLYFSASVGILKIRRAVQREKVCGRGIQPFSPVVSPEGGQSPLLMLAGAGAAEKVLRRDSVCLGFLGKAGREGAEVLCGRVWRQKTCNWHIIRVIGSVDRLCGLWGRLRACICGRRASVGVSGARQRG